MKVILRNETTIEEWILEKAHLRRRHNRNLEPFKNPYDLGRKNNFRLVMNFACLPVGDGIQWPVAQGCDQYSLTVILFSSMKLCTKLQTTEKFK